MPAPAIAESWGTSADTACNGQQTCYSCDEPTRPLSAADHHVDDDYIPSDSESNSTKSSVLSGSSVYDDQK